MEGSRKDLASIKSTKGKTSFYSNSNIPETVRQSGKRNTVLTSKSQYTSKNSNSQYFRSNKFETDSPSSQNLSFDP